VHAGDHLVGQRADADAALQRTLDDLVFDVGDVAHIGHAPAAGQQPAVDHVERQHHAGVAQVALVVDRDAADVHAHVARVRRRKGLQTTREGVVDV
jgi:hypothetical protein